MKREKFKQMKLSRDSFLRIKKINSMIINLMEFTKRSVLVFSPHPDDDILGLAITMFNLNKIGANINIAYQVSGINGVRDRDFYENRNSWYCYTDENVETEMKTLLREKEAQKALRCLGIESKRAHFLRLSFYNNTNPERQADLHKMISLIKSTAPYAVFAAKDTKDPNLTHEKCLELVYEALNLCNYTGRLFHYTSIWDEFDVNEITMLMPFDKKLEYLKRTAVLCHESQLHPLFPGETKAEFWQVKEENSRNMASHLNFAFGTNFYSVEAFSEVLNVSEKNKKLFKNFPPVHEITSSRLIVPI